MYTLPRDKRLVLTDGVAKLARMQPGWSGGSVGITFSQQFGIWSNDERWWELDLVTGAARPLQLLIDLDMTAAQRMADREARSNMSLPPEQRLAAAERYEYKAPSQLYVVDVGMAFITWRRKTAFVRDRSPAGSRGPDPNESVMSDDVTIHVDRWFPIHDQRNDDLDVARDAWFAQDTAHAEKITMQTIPHSSELFLACVKLEHELLQRMSVVDAPLGADLRR